MTGRLDGKRALVTGASRGIGAAIARRLAADGARVIVHYGASRDAAEALAAEIGGVTAQADLATPEGPAALAGAVEGPLDILVHNAGVAVDEPWGAMTVAGFDQMVAVNLRAPLLLTQALAAKLADGGAVALISSLSAVRATLGGRYPVYAATKGGLDAATRHIAMLLGPRAIRVNAVSPGAIATDMATFLASEDGRAAVLAAQALKRIGEPADVAEVVVWLVSDDARWVTGQVIQAGGGARI